MRNDITVIVVDSGLTIASPNLPYKDAATYSDANWTIVVPSTWWDGSWAPAGNRYLRTSGASSEAANCYRISTRPDIPRAAIQCVSNHRSQFKYAFLGAEIFRANDSDSESFYMVTWNRGTGPATLGTEDPKGLALLWSWVNGGDPTPTGYRTTGGCFVSSGGFVFEHSLVTGIARGATETKAILFNPGMRHAQLRWSLAEAHSINILFGGTPYTSFDRTPQDVWIDMVCLPKRQEWNPSSPTYNGIGNQHKQGLEFKYGKRVTIQALDVVNCWMGIQRSALTIQCTPQQPAEEGGRIAETRDIVVRHFRARNVVAPFGMSGSIVNKDNLIAAGESIDNYTDIDIQNVFAIKGPNAELNFASRYDMIRALGTPHLPTDPAVSLWGPITWNWMTFVMANDNEGIGALLRIMSAADDPTRASDTHLTWRNTIAVHNYTTPAGFITERVTNYSDQQTGAAVLDAMKLGGRGVVDIDRVFMPDLGGAFRASFEANYPEQFAANRWFTDQASIGFVDAAANPLEGDYRLAEGSPLKELGDEGRDPGCDIDLLEVACGTLVADIPDYITVIFPT